MKTDVRLCPSWRTLLFFEAILLQQARTILSQVNQSITPISPDQNSTFSSNSLFSAPVGAITAFTTCAPCSVAVTETLLSFPVPVNETTETATATVIPYVTEYPDGTNVTSYSTYSNYNPTAALNNNFTAPSATPLTWTTLGFTLTYPTTYLAYPSPEAGMNAVLTEQGTSYCYVRNFTVLTHLPSSSLLIPYNETLFGETATPTPSGTVLSGTAIPPGSATPSNAPASLALETTASAYKSLSSSLLSWLDTLPQLSAIVGGDPRRCSQTVGPITGAAAVATTLAVPPPTAAFVHTSVAVLTSTGNAVTSSATSLPDQGQSPAGGQGAVQTAGGGGSEGEGGGGPTGAGGESGAGSNGGSGSSGSGGSGGSGGGLGAVVGSAAAQFASTAAITPAPVITVGGSTFGVATGSGGGVVLGGGLASVPPNSAVAINGVSVSLEVQGSTTALVVGGSTLPLGGGTTDGAISSGNGVTSSSSGASATNKSVATTFHASGSVVAIIAGVVIVALGVAL